VQIDGQGRAASLDTTALYSRVNVEELRALLGRFHPREGEPYTGRKEQ
jgi:hypothetical protein